MSKADFAEFEAFKKEVNLVSGKFKAASEKSLKENVKPRKPHDYSTNHELLKNVFCGTVSACDDKEIKVVRGRRGARRRYQLCKFEGTCNQQTHSAKFLLLEAPRNV